jgi:membrane protease subunit (stomatin/prohibitin family)
MVRSVDLNQVYDIMSGHSVVKETTESLNSRLNEYGLQVLSMAIENVSIPEEFADILSQTTEWQIKQKYEQQFHNMRMNLIENNSHQLLLKLKSETGV